MKLGDTPLRRTHLFGGRVVSGLRGSALVISLSALLSLSACQCNDTREEREVTGEGIARSETPSAAGDVAVGTIRGRVVLKANAELPEYPVQEGTLARATPETCPAPPATYKHPVRVEDGGLINVLVSGFGFQKTPPPPAAADHGVRIEGCVMEPRMVHANVGDRLIITNASEQAMLPVFGPIGVEFQVMGKGATQVQQLDESNIFPLRCTAGAACGRAEIAVHAHPVHTVTGEGGRFEITNFPVGEGGSLIFWHPLFITVEESVSVAAGEVKELTITLEPNVHARVEP